MEENTDAIEQRLKDIKNEMSSLDFLKDAYDDTNIHEIEHQQEGLINERYKLTMLLESCFDELIGL
jgi:archaellum component FlaC